LEEKKRGKTVHKWIHKFDEEGEGQKNENGYRERMR
jgi:hypothetical protein